MSIHVKFITKTTFIERRYFITKEPSLLMFLLQQAMNSEMMHILFNSCVNTNNSLRNINFPTIDYGKKP